MTYACRMSLQRAHIWQRRRSNSACDRLCIIEPMRGDGSTARSMALVQTRHVLWPNASGIPFKNASTSSAISGALSGSSAPISLTLRQVPAKNNVNTSSLPCAVAYEINTPSVKRLDSHVNGLAHGAHLAAIGAA